MAIFGKLKFNFGFFAPLSVISIFLLLPSLPLEASETLLTDYVTVDLDPGINFWCLMTPGQSVRVSCPEACPLTCERVLPGEDPKVVARYNKVTRQCDCFSAFGVCELDQLPSESPESFYIAG